MIKFVGIFIIGSMFIFNGYSATVIATVNDHSITDVDVTSRVELMNKQGNTSVDNRRKAFQNIVDDYIKLDYAANFNVKPTNKDAEKELNKMDLGNLSATTKSMALLAIRSDIAWQVIIANSIIPTINVSESDIKAEKVSLARQHGLPVKLTIIRLVDIPSDIAKKLTTPKNCDEAIEIAESFGGYPQKISALQYELSEDMRNMVADLPLLKWSSRVNDSVILICDSEKTEEYKDLDNIIKQNAIYKKASLRAEQQLKQLKRKALIIINDERYKL